MKFIAESSRIATLADDKELAEKALHEAIKIDDEKTSLLFCLISRRASKFNGF